MRNKKFNPVMEAAKTRTRWNIVRGDKVQVIGIHKERGKQGIVKRVIRKMQRLVVEGVNLVKKQLKGDPDRGIPGGRVVEVEQSLPYSSVMLLDPVHNVPTRIALKYLEDGRKVRVSKKSGAIIPKPLASQVVKPRVRTTVTESCTKEADVWEMTYVQPPPFVPFFKLKKMRGTGTDKEEEDQETGATVEDKK